MDNNMFLMVTVGVSLLIIIIFVSVTSFQIAAENAKKSKLKFPPFPSKCPDYWEAVGDGRCKNINNIGICKKYNGVKDSDVMDFSDPLFKGEKGMYYKCSWSRKCQAPWEGIDELCI